MCEVASLPRSGAGFRPGPDRGPLIRAAPAARVPEPLWRTVAGEQLRAARRERHETLAVVAARAGISVQYLSEIERGRKEPSSEVLAAVVGALRLTLVDLTLAVSRELWIDARPVAVGPVASATAVGPVLLAA